MRLKVNIEKQRNTDDGYLEKLSDKIRVHLHCGQANTKAISHYI